MYFSFALAGHRSTCLRPLHIFALLRFASAHYKATSAHMKQIYLLLLPSFNVPQVSRQLTDENQY